MRPYFYLVEPNPDYDRTFIDNRNHQYLVNFLLDCMIPWRNARDRPQTFDSEKVRCERVIRRVSLLLKRITTKPTSELKGKVVVNIMQVQKLMVEQLPYFSEQTREYCRQQIEEHLRFYREEWAS